MICQSCGQPIDRIDHIVFIDGEACCRLTIEQNYGSLDAYLDEVEEN